MEKYFGRIDISALLLFVAGGCMRRFMHMEKDGWYFIYGAIILILSKWIYMLCHWQKYREKYIHHLIIIGISLVIIAVINIL